MTVTLAAVLGAFACIALCALLTVTQAREHRRELERRERVRDAERAELLNRIMYMAHQPWQLPEEAVTPSSEPAFNGEFVYPELEPEPEWQ